MLCQIQPSTDLFGLPLPSNDPGFVTVLIIHILLSFGAVLFGLVAMLKDKHSLAHSRFGKLYYWAIISAFVTVIILAVIRWPHNSHLLVIGTLTAVLVFAGRRLAQKKRPKWPRLHTICMGCSYILLLTGFYVDNGEHLPFWNHFPKCFFYIFPTLVGVPIIAVVLRRHPLTRRQTRHSPKHVSE